MKRTKHSLSHYKLLTCDMGKLYPITAYEVLPGDSIQQATSLLVRCSPLLAPVMHPVTVRVHHWFVPNRIMWDGWEDFITGLDDTPPPTRPSGGGFTPGGIADYMGIPPLVGGINVSMFPFIAYARIWNEFYRDQDLQAELALDGSNASIKPVGWEKDYFSAARPWSQKGGEITLPLGQSAPVRATGPGAGPSFKIGSGPTMELQGGAGASPTSWSVVPTFTGVADWVSTGLEADLSQATATNINDIRRAFALQRYEEARALYGSRYTEYLAYLGVRSSDARLQRPEYLGGGKQTISFSEVLKTGGLDASPDDPIGTLKGHGIAAMRSRRYRRFFEEHGWVLSLLSVRPRTMYTNGIHRSFSRVTKEDYWQKELEQIGQQEVYNREVYAEADGDGVTTGGNRIFGYQDRYSEYRHHPSSVAAEFRTTLNYWHLARSFSSAPVLNASFIECDPAKRIFAEQTQNSLWIMASHHIQARRMVSNNTVGRII